MLMPEEAGGLHLNAVEEGLIGGILLLGCAVGAVLGGRMSDRYGRRHNILILAVVFFVGAVGCALAPNITLMYLARFVLGLRSEEHTSELQSRGHLVCRLLLVNKK